MHFDQVTVNGVNSNVSVVYYYIILYPYLTSIQKSSILKVRAAGEIAVPCTCNQEVRKITRREKEIIGNFVFMIQFIIGMIQSP